MLERNSEIKSTHEMKKCSSPIWYKDFKNVSIKSFFLKIPTNVLTYLRDEIIILPTECSTDNEIVHEGFEDEDTEEIEPPTFPEFSQQITKIIKKLGGSAFIKTNWHCPKDAFWITPGQTMKCKDITDVYTLIKASSVCKEDLINHSLPCASGNQLEYYLVFKKWKDIHTGTEFRCFVRNKHLVAISPRDWPEYHEHMKAQRSEIISDIVKLFKNEIKPKFTLMDCKFCLNN